MAKIIGAAVLSKYSSGEQHNSFYEEQDGNHSSKNFPYCGIE